MPAGAGPNLLASWIGMLGGILSGIVMGLYFHDEAWMGGYSTFPRRLIRLGHIAFFGLGFLNFAFAFTARVVPITGFLLRLASWSLIVGLITMPLCCFLTAWRKALRRLFPIPVASVLVGIAAILAGWTHP